MRSPQADDGDACDLVGALAPDLVLLVADAGLGTINSIRLSMDALAPPPGGPVPAVVVLNRYDDHHEIHRRNRDLAGRPRRLPGHHPARWETELADLVTGADASPDACEARDGRDGAGSASWYRRGHVDRAGPPVITVSHLTKSYGLTPCR